MTSGVFTIATRQLDKNLHAMALRSRSWKGHKNTISLKLHCTKCQVCTTILFFRSKNKKSAVVAAEAETDNKKSAGSAEVLR